MKKSAFFLLAFLLPVLVFSSGKDKNKDRPGTGILSGPEPRPDKKDAKQDEGVLTIKNIFGSGMFSAKAKGGYTMLKNGNYCVEDYDASNKAYEILEYSFTKDSVVDTLFSQKFITDTTALPKNFALENFQISENKKYILLQTATQSIYRHSKKAIYYIYSIRTHKIKKVHHDKEVFYATFSPDESKVAYVFDNNLYIQYFLYGDSTVQVTKDGLLNNVLNGKTDWVYEEEFSMSQGYEWSPKGDKIIYYRFDESKVKMYQLDYYDSLYPTIYKYKYPVAGEDNSKVSVWVYDLNVDIKRKLELHEENDQYIPRISWTKDDNTVAVERLNRQQNNLELIEASSPGWKLKTVLKEHDNDYIEITDNLYFFDDNSFMMSSSKSGFNNIYLYDHDGKELRNLTPYRFDIENILGYDDSAKTIFYSAKEPNPRTSTVFQVNLDGTGKKTLNDDEKGSTSVEFASDYKHYLMTTSSAMVPYVCAVYDNNGKKLKGVEDNAELNQTIKNEKFSPKEFFDLNLADTESLSIWMIKPPHFKKHHKYPVLFSIYGGPGIQTVNDAWGGTLDMWYQYLARKGYIIVSVDNRGTGGKGRDFKHTTYLKLGQKESDDQIAAAKYLAKQDYVDPKRIGMYGWSFGGYMSAMCITKGADVFNTAVAVAPVTDWRYYDNIYTERYMGLPKDNSDNYDATSVLTYVPKLKGNFLVIFGTYDDNVHPQNSIMLVKKMVELNKKYDSEFYPNKNHGIYGGYTRLHLYTRITDYILEHL